MQLLLAGVLVMSAGAAVRADEVAAALRCEGLHCRMPRAAGRRMLADLRGFTRTARLVPVLGGFRLSRVQPDSYWTHLGFRDGDTLRTVGGVALTSIGAAREAHARVKEADRIEVGFLRDGEALVFVLTLE